LQASYNIGNLLLPLVFSCLITIATLPHRRFHNSQSFSRLTALLLDTR
jgi:hypothetical protein